MDELKRRKLLLRYMGRSQAWVEIRQSCINSLERNSREMDEKISDIGTRYGEIEWLQQGSEGWRDAKVSNLIGPYLIIKDNNEAKIDELHKLPNIFDVTEEMVSAEVHEAMVNEGYGAVACFREAGKALEAYAAGVKEAIAAGEKEHSAQNIGRKKALNAVAGIPGLHHLTQASQVALAEP